MTDIINSWDFIMMCLYEDSAEANPDVVTVAELRNSVTSFAHCWHNAMLCSLVTPSDQVCHPTVVDASVLSK